MEHKEKYLKAFIMNHGRINEIDLGETIGLNENETREIIAQLLSENTIEYAEHGACEYRIIKKRKNESKSY